MQHLAHTGFVAIQLLPGGGDYLLETSREEFLPQLAEVIIPTYFRAETGGLHAVGGVHEFEVLQAVGGGP